MYAKQISTNLLLKPTVGRTVFPSEGHERLGNSSKQHHTPHQRVTKRKLQSTIY